MPRTTGSFRNGLAVLGEPDFRRYVIGQASSAIGTGMVPVAISFAVLGRGGSASEVGDVFASGTLPIVAFLLIGGVVADRFGRRRVMVGSDLLRALAQGALGLSLLVGHPPLVAFVVAEALVGTGTAFFTPAIVGLIPQITSASRRQQANTLNAMATFSGNLVGPAISGILVATAGASWAVVADAASYLISASCLIRLSPVVIERSGETRHFLHELAEGWRDFRSRTWLWVVVGQFSLFHLIVFAPFLVLGAVVARDSLGGAGAWGAILAAQGAGSIVAGVVMLHVHPRRPLLVAELAVSTWSLPLLAVALRAPVPLDALAAAAAGAGFGIFGPLWDTTMQREIPPELLSRVSAYDWFGSTAFLPLGAAIAGPIAAVIGIKSALLGGAAFMALGAGVVLGVRSVTGLTAGPLPAAERVGVQ